MKKSISILGLFCCVAILQLAMPISTIVRHEMTLRNGHQFRFRTKPVDPYDAFRGRYVALRLEADQALLSKDVNLKRHQKVYALIQEGKEGFAKIANVTVKRPEGDTYVQARVNYVERTKQEVHLYLPFNRYYMEENLAPDAEAAYRKHSQREKHNAYITVRIKSGFAAVEDLYIAGKPILEFLKEEE